jgi:flagellar M-ring protein FliF
MGRLKNERIVIGTINSNGYVATPELSSANNQSTAIVQPNPAVQLLARKKKGLLPMGDIEDEISDEAMLKKNQQERIVNYVTKNPMDAAKLINAWMHEDEI